jgi:cation transport ATPase
MPAGALLLSGQVTGRVAAGPVDREAALDREVLATLSRIDAARIEPTPGTWEDAAVRGLFTAGLGCAAFALVTQAWLGSGPLGPGAIFAAAAVLVGTSPSALLTAAHWGRAAAVVRARLLGVLVRDPAALEAIALVDTVCLDGGAVAPQAPAVRALGARRLRALLLRDDRRGAAALADLQYAGARVLLLGGDPAAAAQADVAVAVGPVTAPAGAAIVVPEGSLEALVGLVDLGRALRAVLRQNLALAAIYNVAVIPAAALGYLSPLHAAALALADTLLGLGNAARLLRAARR